MPLRTASRKVSAFYNEYLQPLEINIAQFSLMQKIKKKGEISITNLSHLSDLDRSTIGRNLRVLEKSQLVALNNGIDQRETTVVLTEEGYETLRKAEPLWLKAQAEFETKLGGPDKVKQFLEVLKSL